MAALATQCQGTAYGFGKGVSLDRPKMITFRYILHLTSPPLIRTNHNLGLICLKQHKRKMGLKGEFDEFVSDWKKYPYWLKIVLGISLFISVSSITSLSDVVFKWKGFIKEGLDFYSVYISSRLKSFYHILGLNLSDPMIDFLVLINLLGAMPLIRTWWSFQKRKVNDFHSHIFFLLSPLLFITFLPFVINEHEKWSFFHWYCIGIFILGLIHGCIYQDKSLSRLFPTIISLIVVLILAAINEGLTR